MRVKLLKAWHRSGLNIGPTCVLDTEGPDGGLFTISLAEGKNIIANEIGEELIEEVLEVHETLKPAAAPEVDDGTVATRKRKGAWRAQQ